MDIGELIIGSYVKLGKNIVQIERLDFCHNIFLRKLESIPLTEQWLIDLGFVDSKSYGFGVQYTLYIEGFGDVNLWKDDEKQYFTFITGDREAFYHNSFSVEINYVHQLQGLVKFISGKLLTK